jgi:hypothetical protein
VKSQACRKVTIEAFIFVMLSVLRCHMYRVRFNMVLCDIVNSIVVWFIHVFILITVK